MIKAPLLFYVTLIEREILPFQYIPSFLLQLTLLHKEVMQDLLQLFSTQSSFSILEDFFLPFFSWWQEQLAADQISKQQNKSGNSYLFTVT